MKTSVPKFKVGQVVRHRIDGAFYSRVIDRMSTSLRVEEGQVVVMEQGCIRIYREQQLRSLTKREIGR